MKNTTQKLAPKSSMINPDTFWANIVNNINVDSHYGDRLKGTTAYFSDLVGKTLVALYVDEFHSDQIYLLDSDNKLYVLYHSQDCCENVWIESVVGDVKDLLDNPLLVAEESTVDLSNTASYESATATFYKLATIKGYVDIRFVGESNGCYSESVDCKVFDLNKLGITND